MCKGCKQLMKQNSQLNCLSNISLYSAFNSVEYIPEFERANQCSFLLLITWNCVHVIDLSAKIH